MAGGLRPRQLITWLGAQTTHQVARTAPGQPPPDMPDRLIMVTFTGGAGLMLEGAFDRLTFQVRCRGGQNEPDSADDMAFEVDTALLTAHMPTIDAIPTLGFTRTGSPPAPSQTDDGERPTTVCTYMVRAASAL